MRSIIITSIALITLSGPLFAAETKQVTRDVTTYTISDNPEFAKKVDAVCTDKTIHLSAKARTACDSHTFPNITKTSKQFRNAGYGAELNALANQR